jgi:hypothetical protein
MHANSANQIIHRKTRGEFRTMMSGLMAKCCTFSNRIQIILFSGVSGRFEKGKDTIRTDMWTSQSEFENRQPRLSADGGYLWTCSTSSEMITDRRDSSLLKSRMNNQVNECHTFQHNRELSIDIFDISRIAALEAFQKLRRSIVVEPDQITVTKCIGCPTGH